MDLISNPHDWRSRQFLRIGEAPIVESISNLRDIEKASLAHYISFKMPLDVPNYIDQKWLRFPGVGGCGRGLLPFVSNYAHDHWQCLLCGTGGMIGNNRFKHFRGRRHRERFEVWRSAVKQKYWLSLCEEITPIKQRIDKLGFGGWRSNVNDQLLKYLTTSRNDDKVLTNALSTLEKYEQMERISLLELAVWKSHCLGYTITNDSSKDVIFETMQDIEDYGALDTTFNPAEFRKIRRVTSGVNVIVRLVITFL